MSFILEQKFFEGYKDYVNFFIYIYEIGKRKVYVSTMKSNRVLIEGNFRHSHLKSVVFNHFTPCSPTRTETHVFRFIFSSCIPGFSLSPPFDLVFLWRDPLPSSEIHHLVFVPRDRRLTDLIGVPESTVKKKVRKKEETK